MMASSQRAVFTRQRNDTTRVYVTSFTTIILLYLSISVESSIHSVQERFTARVGDTVNIPYEYCGQPKPSCTPHSFNLSAPNPTCTVDRHGHCVVARAPDNDPFRDDRLGIGCELCVLVIHGVSERDAGRYAMCQTSGSCTSAFWRNISTLEVEKPPTPTDSTSMKVTTKPTTESTKTTKQEDPPKNVSEIHTLPSTDAPPGKTARSGMSTSSKVGIPITIVSLVILFIVGAVYFWKRTNRTRNTPLSPESPYANTTTVPINGGSPDVYNIQVANEVTHLRAESESDT